MERDRQPAFRFTRDPQVEEERHHASEVAEWAVAIGRAIGMHRDSLERLELAALLHDVGKSEIPREILAKPGPLDAAEWRVVRRHPEEGARVLSHSYFDDVRHIVLHHHERYDGTGYPYGLFGRSIPLESRIIAVADAWHAMTCDRPYRSAMSEERALSEIERGIGSQFDPVCAEALIGIVFSLRGNARRAAQRQQRAAAPAPPAA